MKTSAERKATPVYSGVLRYFPLALQAVAQLSKAGNDKHNPGEPLHWSRDKSNDHLDCIVRHLIDAGTIDEEDGFLHDVKIAWRALANLELALERASTRKEPDEVRVLCNYCGKCGKLKPVVHTECACQYEVEKLTVRCGVTAPPPPPLSVEHDDIARELDRMGLREGRAAGRDVLVHIPTHPDPLDDINVRDVLPCTFDGCVAKFVSAEGLRMHALNEMHPQKPTEFTCWYPECDTRRFDDAVTRNAHLLAVHGRKA